MPKLHHNQTGQGFVSTFSLDVYIEGTEFMFDCDVVLAWSRFTSTNVSDSSYRYFGFGFQIDSNPDIPYARVDNIVPSGGGFEATTWYNDDTVADEKKVHITKKWTGLTPGQHTLKIIYNSTSGSIVPIPSGATLSDYKNINLAIFNLFSNSLFPGIVRNYKGSETQNMVVTGLVDELSGSMGDLLTFDPEGRLRPSTVSETTIANMSAAIDAIEDNVTLVQNNDVDIGTETVDTIPITAGAVWWDVSLKKGNNIRNGTILATVVNGNVEWSYGAFSPDNGDTSAVTFNVSAAGNDVLLQAIATSDDWDVRAFRKVIEY
jgi:hypothetical protein